MPSDDNSTIDSAADQILAAFTETGDYETGLAHIQARADAIIGEAQAMQAEQASAWKDDARHQKQIADIAKRERRKDDRMHAYRGVTNERLEALAEDDPLAHLLAHATTLARGGELSEALLFAQLAGAISRAEKNRALSHAPLVHFVSNSRKISQDSATITVNTTAARASLAKLIDHALQGDVVVIQRANRSVARLVPYWAPDEPPASCPPGAIDLST